MSMIKTLHLKIFLFKRKRLVLKQQRTVHCMYFLIILHIGYISVLTFTYKVAQVQQ